MSFPGWVFPDRLQPITFWPDIVPSTSHQTFISFFLHSLGFLRTAEKTTHHVITTSVWASIYLPFPPLAAKYLNTHIAGGGAAHLLHLWFTHYVIFALLCSTLLSGIRPNPNVYYKFPLGCVCSRCTQAHASLVVTSYNALPSQLCFIATIQCPPACYPLIPDFSSLTKSTLTSIVFFLWMEWVFGMSKRSSARTDALAPNCFAFFMT